MSDILASYRARLRCQILIIALFLTKEENYRVIFLQAFYDYVP